MKVRLYHKLYVEENYEGKFNILAGERRLMTEALKKTRGVMKSAWKLCCPTVPNYYTYPYFRKQVKRHGIDLRIIAEEKVRSAKVQRNLRALAKKRNITLRSIKDET